MKEGMIMRRDSDELLMFIFDSIGHVATLISNNEILEALAKMGRDIVYADRCTIWLLDKKEEILWTQVADGVDKITMEPKEGIVGACVQSGEAEIINDVYADTRFNKTIDKATGYKTNTMMVIPMKNRKGKVVGAIQVINKENQESFSQEDMKFLRLAATYIAETIKSTFLLQEIDATQRELIHILGVVGETRSKETAYHVKRVAEFAYLLAKLYGLSEEESLIVRDAAPLHDIGKLGITDNILHKPGKLDNAEKINMMTHSELGYHMLKDSERELLQAGAVVAYEHHEKYDGTGYPRKLKGEEIHIYGRIVSLADVFDALSSDRIYKKAWPLEEVVTYIKEERGRHFDPNLVDLFLENFDDFKVIRETYMDVFHGK